MREKNQTEQQQEQASDEISIYYLTGAAHFGENITLKNKNAIISTKKEGLKSKNANWKIVYDDLNMIKKAYFKKLDITLTPPLGVTI